MRRNLATLAALMLLPTGQVLALSVDDVSVPSVTLIFIDDIDDPAIVRDRVSDLLDDGHRVVLGGSPAALSLVRPSFVGAWPATNTIVLDPGMGLGIHGFDAADADAVRTSIAQWPWSKNTQEAAGRRSERGVAAHERTRRFQFGMAAATPALLCRNMAHELDAAMFGTSPRSDADRRSLRKEARRWCQYGTLPTHISESPQFTIGSSWQRNYGLLSLVTEWALVRDEDDADASRTQYTFWTKTLGTGAGFGFTREQGSEAWLSSDGRLNGLMDVAMHAGWGPLESRGTASTWPAESSFPYSRNIGVFRCEQPAASRPEGCPVLPVLSKLYPEDSSNGIVKVSPGEGLDVVGHATVSGHSGRGNALSLHLSVARHGLIASTLAMPLVRTQSNADTTFFRTTRWTPDIPALYRWAASRRQLGGMASVTPLASSLNPHYEAVWELPSMGNLGRDLPFHLIYELGWNTCINELACTDREGDGSIRPRAKTRMGWSDDIVLHLPED